MPKSPSRIRLFFGGLWPQVPIVHRYVSRELLVVCVLSSLALTSLTALCGLIKPLRQHGVSATELLEILLLLFPVFLIFILPFAIMLACCWVYGRLSADNELNACSSSGINIQTLLIVPLVLGLLGMILSGFLANWLVPNWALDRFEGLLARHGKDIAYRQLRRRGSFTLSHQQIGRSYIIHADKVYHEQDVLTGIAVAVFAGASQQPERIVAADKATLLFFPSAKGGLPDSIAVLTERATTVELPEYDIGQVASLIFSGKIRPRIKQNLASMSLADLRAMGRNPELYSPIRDLAQRARRIFIAHQLVKRMYVDLDQRGYFEFYGRRKYRLAGQAAKVLFTDEGAKNFLANAVITEYDPTGERITRRFTDAKQVDLELVELPPQDGRQALTATIVLRNASIERPGPAPGKKNLPAKKKNLLEASRLRIGQLGIPQDIVQRGRAVSLNQIRRADFTKLFPQRLRYIGSVINKQQDKLAKEIALEIHSRLAMAACCPVLAVLGALLGAIFRRGQFLMAVGLSLGPAVVAMLFIIMGQHMIDSPIFSTQTAVAVSWTGLILLILANLILGVKVLRR